MTDAVNWPELMTSLLAGKDIAYAHALDAMSEVMNGHVKPEVLAGFLVALAGKGVAVTELSGLADGMIAYAQTIDLPVTSIDIVGTGGDRFMTANISTMASLVVAASGVKIVKHGNKASSSACGSADLLQAAGVNITLNSGQIKEIFTQLGVAFLFANVFHPAMKYVAPVRRALKIPTVFNVIGPLSNPVQPQYNLIGCYSDKIAPLMAEVLAKRGKSALVVRGENGLDELSTVCLNHIWQVYEGKVKHFTFDAVKELHISVAQVEQLRGGDATYNAHIMQDIFAGELTGPIQEAVLLNAAAALVVMSGNMTADSETSFAKQMSNTYEQVKEVLISGKPAKLLADWVCLSNR